jgi:hypothetical protein
MSNKFKYPIDPKRIYTLEYDNLSGEIAGEEILKAFKAMIERKIRGNEDKGEQKLQQAEWESRKKAPKDF